MFVPMIPPGPLLNQPLTKSPCSGCRASPSTSRPSPQCAALPRSKGTPWRGITSYPILSNTALHPSMRYFSPVPRAPCRPASPVRAVRSNSTDVSLPSTPLYATGELKKWRNVARPPSGSPSADCSRWSISSSVSSLALFAINCSILFLGRDASTSSLLASFSSRMWAFLAYTVGFSMSSNISRSSLFENAICPGPRLPKRCTSETVLDLSVFSALSVISVVFRTSGPFNITRAISSPTLP
mmetsp:Transcript_13293/g.52980  ORF Transcript_13293/g.52980 Transcript_13293/m.52980 type:complete len:241 (-) Transcript_13293:596-1318(-)